MAVVSNRSCRSFTERDRAMLNALLPHIKVAYTNACAFDSLQQDAEVFTQVGGHSYLQVARDGRIVRAGTRARSILNAYLPTRDRVGDRLRGRLAAWFGEQVEDRLADCVCRQTEVVSTAGTLSLRLLESAHQGDWLLVLQHASAKQERALDAEVASLPPRAQEVLRLLLDGDGEKQVAAKLEISKHTVHDHVKRIYRTFGVSARSELLARFISPA